MVKQGNIIRIAPISKIQQEQEIARRTMEQKKAIRATYYPLFKGKLHNRSRGLSKIGKISNKTGNNKLRHSHKSIDYIRYKRGCGQGSKGAQEIRST